METKDEQKFARMSLLDDSDHEDNSRLSSPLSPKTPSTSNKAASGVREPTRGTPTPPDSVTTQPLRRGNSLRQEAFGPEDGTTSLRTPPRMSSETASPVYQHTGSSSTIPTSTTGGRTVSQHTGSSNVGTAVATPSAFNPDVARRRGSSLSSRFAGDQSHRPLDIIRRESVKANRAPHLRRAAHQGTDSIDKLAGIDGAPLFHHEGPYDVASLARNQRWRDSPLEAIEQTNRESLKSVQREKVLDSLERHRPLDGFAYVPPGIRDEHGRIFQYEEGTDMQRVPGADYRRWPGAFDYHPDDLKGKGEPSYSIEKALKENGSHDHRRVVSEGGIELGAWRGPSRSRSLHVAGSGNEQRYSEWRADVAHNGSRRHQAADGLRRRIGSLRHRGAPPPPPPTAEQEVREAGREVEG